jgi:N-ethylmaleimide reductase
MKDLFDPYDFQGHRFANRVVMAPMTRSRAADDGTPTSMMVDYYAQRAEAGAIVSEGTNVSPQGQGFLNTPGIFTPAHIEAWRHVTAAVHARGSAFFLQLWHVGRIGHPDNMQRGLHPVAPSALVHARTIVTRSGAQPTMVPRAMSLDEVQQTVADYATAARNAIQAGCDGVEIHAANGYLPSQFLHATSNHRTDRYGGSIANRIRFLVETAQACATAIGADRVGVRVTPFSAFNGATSPDDEAALYDELIAALARLELGYLHAVSAEVSGNVTVEEAERHKVADVLGFVRPRWRRTLIAAGNFDLARAQAAVRDGRADLVAFGRDFIANPDLVTRLRHGHPLAARNPATRSRPAIPQSGMAPESRATPTTRVGTVFLPPARRCNSKAPSERLRRSGAGRAHRRRHRCGRRIGSRDPGPARRHGRQRGRARPARDRARPAGRASVIGV